MVDFVCNVIGLQTTCIDGISVQQ